MIIKKDMTLLLLLGIFLVVTFSHNLLSVGEISYCCERTNSGAWCQDVPELNNCNSFFRSVPTSCESTSYCKLGTCVNTIDGVCMENTPQKVCEENVGGVSNGLWFDSNVNDVPQCQLGCCFIGDQAAFTTQTRCKQLSSLYGLETNYRNDIRSEVECIASAFPKEKGACVFEEEFQRTCRFTTKQDCQSVEGGKFHSGFLCSATNLSTNCGPSRKTTLVDGRDEVFFVDSCGNLANIYDVSKINIQTYWDKIVPKEESCGATSGNGNAGNPSCGNCDFLDGSTGALYDVFLDGVGARPDFGDYVCRDLDCKFEIDLNGDGDSSDEGEFGPFQHGESWCARSPGVGEIISDEGELTGGTNPNRENLPGSRYFRLVCYNGDVTVEPCADFRQEICIESEFDTDQGKFKTAACRVNKWEDCAAQKSRGNCNNFEKRDCKWISGDKCVPKYPPGFNFWDEREDAGALCLQASATCTIRIEKTVLDRLQGRSLEEACAGEDLQGSISGCECLTDSWKNSQNNICLAFGDCGASKNYLGK